MPEKNLLIIECQSRISHYENFENTRLNNGDIVKVWQCGWDDFSYTSYSDGKVYVEIRRSHKLPKGHPYNFKLDFILMRSVTWGLSGQDSRHKLYGLMFADIPSVNSLHSCYMALERPVAQAPLFKLARKHGSKFPMLESYGKIKVDNGTVWQDVKSLVAPHGDYAMAQPFVEWDFDIRVQKIGSHYRVFRRKSANWKGNVGSAVIEESSMTPEYQFMIEEAAKIFGGLDICALDLLHDPKTDKEFILELNDTAIGLVRSLEPEDHKHLMELVMLRMNQHFCPDSPPIPKITTPVASTSSSENKLKGSKLSPRKVLSKVFKKTSQDPPPSSS